jgi:hypothetical protein
MRSRRPRASSTAGARRQARCRRRASSTGSVRYGYQRAVRIEGARGSAQIVQLLHGALHRFTSATMDAISSPPGPIASPLEVCGRRPPDVRGTTFMGPASENLHRSGHPALPALPSKETCRAPVCMSQRCLAGMSAQKAQGLLVELCDAFVDSGMRAAFKNQKLTTRNSILECVGEAQ